ncbi:VapE domain-containing protein [Schleiferilactobacillus harbinensis]|uniref:VapE domain-containing protein n=1 Tax=Schleiferilactobacillus harbinensis TaxID=304207 RepID=UPI0039E9600E
MLYEQNGFKNSTMTAVPTAATDFEELKQMAQNPQQANVDENNVSDFKANQLQYIVAGTLDDGKRANDSYHNASLVLVDFDEINDEAEFVNKVATVFNRISYVLYPSISYGFKGVRYHLALDPSRPIKNKEEKTAVLGVINQLLGVQSDEAMATWVQMFGAPVETEQNKGKIVIHDGEKFNVDQAIANYQPEQKPENDMTKIMAYYRIQQQGNDKSHHTISEQIALPAIAKWAAKNQAKLESEMEFTKVIRFLVEEQNEGKLAAKVVDAAGTILAMGNQEWAIRNADKIETQRKEHLEPNKLNFNQFFGSSQAPQWVITTDKGQPIAGASSNVVEWLKWAVQENKTELKSLRFNEFTNQYEIKNGQCLHNLTDRDVRQIGQDIQRISLVNPTKDAMFDGVYQFGDENAYNPVVDLIKSTQWDGKQRISTVFIDYLGAEDIRYTRKISRVWMLALVNRTIHPGASADVTPILIGKQGIGKSTLAKRLALSDDYYSDSLRDMAGNKDELSKLAGKTVVELGELASMKKSTIEDVKAFISKATDEFRPAYGRTVEAYKRTASFIGTSNSSDVLTDSTGNRRFWPIECGQQEATKDVFLLKNNDDEVKQMYAEAYQAIQNNEHTYLTHEEIVEFSSVQRNYEKYDVYKEALEKTLAVIEYNGNVTGKIEPISKEDLTDKVWDMIKDSDETEGMRVTYPAARSHVTKLMGASQRWSEKRVGPKNGHRERMYVFNK